VYAADIGPLGFQFVELDGAVTDAAVAEVRALLADPVRRAAEADHHFAIGKAHLGYDRLQEALTDLLAST
jgi:hypothetical protein